MTTTVTKGTNRPSAMARKAKHAQTTPLPPKAKAEQVVETFKAKYAQEAETNAAIRERDGFLKGLQSRTGMVHYARQDAPTKDGYRAVLQVCGMSRTQHLSLDAGEHVQAMEVTCKRCHKSTFATAEAHLRAKQAEAAAAKPEPKARTRKPKAAPAPAPEPTETVQEASKPAPKPRSRKAAPAHEEPQESTPLATPADSKAHRVAALPEYAGWITTVQVDGDYAELVATRDGSGLAETIHQFWIKGVYQHPATYTIGDRTVQIRNASESRRYASRSPEVAAAEFAKVGANQSFRKRAVPEEEQDRKPLPFALDAPEKTVVDALVGRKVRWYNRLTAVPEVAVLGTDPRRVTVQEMADGERVVLFCSPGFGGFRAFRLSALLAVK